MLKTIKCLQIAAFRLSFVIISPDFLCLPLGCVMRTSCLRRSYFLAPPPPFVTKRGCGANSVLIFGSQSPWKNRAWRNPNRRRSAKNDWTESLWDCFLTWRGYPDPQKKTGGDPCQSGRHHVGPFGGSSPGCSAPWRTNARSTSLISTVLLRLAVWEIRGWVFVNRGEGRGAGWLWCLWPYVLLLKSCSKCARAPTKRDFFWIQPPWKMWLYVPAALDQPEKDDL